MGLKEWRKKLKWLDPFTYVDLWVMPKVNPDNNKVIETVVYVVFAFIFALALYALLGLILWTKNPLVIVVSGSMQPNLYRGDVVVMHGINPPDIKGETVEINTDLAGKTLDEFASVDYAGQTMTINGQTLPLNQSGDTVVYYSDLTGVQIIHRVVANIKTPQGHYLLTKGDNQTTNQSIDQDCGQVYAKQLHNQSLVNAPKQWFQLSGTEYCACTIPPRNEVVKGTNCLVCSEKPCNTVQPIKAEQTDGIQILRIPLLGCIKLWLLDDLVSLLAGRGLPSHFNGVC
jgi:signal peptidase I